MTEIRDLHARWMKDPVFQKEFEALEGECATAGEQIRARVKASCDDFQS